MDLKVVMPAIWGTDLDGDFRTGVGLRRFAVKRAVGIAWRIRRVLRVGLIRVELAAPQRRHRSYEICECRYHIVIAPHCALGGFIYRCAAAARVIARIIPAPTVELSTALSFTKPILVNLIGGFDAFPRWTFTRMIRALIE